MKFQFDPDQSFQKTAINSIVKIFEGIQPDKHEHIIKMGTQKQDFLPSFIDVISNGLDTANHQSIIKHNMQRIQTENGVPLTDDTQNFSIEMETGTGKTYVYLRTIFELYQTYRLKKFIIVVPSVPIRTGVIKTLEQTKSHFENLYPGVKYDYYDYNSNKIDKMRDFYMSNNIQIMIITSHSFASEDKVIHRIGREDVGELSLIQYISACRPIMILDEPQSILGTKTKEMIKLFTPLFSLYYSATHKEKFSCMYQLSPTEAYNHGLVKKIQVASLTSQANQSSLDIACISVENDNKGKLFTKLELHKRLVNGSIKKAEIKCKKGDILFDKTNNPLYIGWIVGDMRRGQSVILVKGGSEITLIAGEQSTGNAHDMIKAQIKQTVDMHFAKKAEIVSKDIKPLTLIFIDKVPNFIGSEEYIQTYFCECLKQHITTERDEKTKPYAYYFANKKNKREGTVEYIDELGNSKEAREIEKQMYELIMREKETLLSFDNPVEFIFSHSALKEGWDNPNVFTLCTLRNSISETEKRQSVGRGLRLPVNQSGLRVYDKNINRLSVVVNQSYEDFCEQYQNNLIAEGYTDYEASRSAGNIENGLPETIEVNPKRAKNAVFQGFWSAINHKTYFSVSLSEDKLIETCIQRINNTIETHHVTGSNIIQVSIAGVEISKQGVGGIEEDSLTIQGEKQVFTVGSLVKVVQNELKTHKVSCSRKTIAEILKNMKQIRLFAKNPLQCAMLVANIIHSTITEQYKDCCEYHLSEETYQLSDITNPVKIFKAQANYPKSLLCGEKGLFEKIMVDSSIEEEFGNEFQKDAIVDFFFKLNDVSFKIKTPVGMFTPDWGVVITKNNEHKEQEVYFMVENKGSRDDLQLKTTESIKIACAKKHFSKLRESMKDGFLLCDRYDKYIQFKTETRSL